ncbi:hypothetical protein MY9_3752 [Bacillus sp. JS]|nr:hypothetical protein MY9_3752 [Bacillus sp. JS]
MFFFLSLSYFPTIVGFFFMLEYENAKRYRASCLLCCFHFLFKIT